MAAAGENENPEFGGEPKEPTPEEQREAEIKATFERLLAERLEDKFESTTSSWLRRQAAILEMDAYRYLTPETETQAMMRLRREIARGRQVIPARLLYRLALQLHHQTRSRDSDEAESWMYLIPNV